MSISLLSTWAVGILNGYQLKDGGLPTDIKYGTMGLATAARMVHIFRNITPSISTGLVLFALFGGAPLAVGGTFCIGHQLGKAARHTRDVPFASGPPKHQML